MQGAWVQSLGRKLSSCMPRSAAKTKKKDCDGGLFDIIAIII